MNMKKFIALLLAVIVCVGVLCACDSKRTEGAPDGMKAVTSSGDLPYNFYIPAAWTQDLSAGAVSAYCNSSDLSNVSMTQFKLTTSSTLKDETDKYVKELEETFKDFKLEKRSDITLDKTAATKLEYTGKLVGDSYKFMTVVCYRGGAIYVFTYTSTVDNYDLHTTEVENMLKNFSFKKQ